MKLLNIQNRIAELMTIFTTQIRAATAMRRTDINHVAETILVPLFAEVYGYKNLKNLNFTESDNYPGIDLEDEDAKVAFQITSTAKSDKIKSTLRSFVETLPHFAIGVFFDSSYPSCGRLSRPLTTIEAPSP